MSDQQLRKLFAMIDSLTAEIAEMKAVVNLASANSGLVVQGYQAHGGEIEALKRALERLKIRCPLMKPETDEFAKVEV